MGRILTDIHQSQQANYPLSPGDAWYQNSGLSDIVSPKWATRSGGTVEAFLEAFPKPTFNPIIVSYNFERTILYAIDSLSLFKFDNGVWVSVSNLPTQITNPWQLHIEGTEIFIASPSDLPIHSFIYSDDLGLTWEIKTVNTGSSLTLIQSVVRHEAGNYLVAYRTNNVYSSAVNSFTGWTLKSTGMNNAFPTSAAFGRDFITKDTILFRRSSGIEAARMDSLSTNFVSMGVMNPDGITSGVRWEGFYPFMPIQSFNSSGGWYGIVTSQADNPRNGIIKTNDNGANWSLVNRIPNGLPGTQSIFVLSENIFALMTTEGVFLTENGGVSFVNIDFDAMFLNGGIRLSDNPFSIEVITAEGAIWNRGNRALQVGNDRAKRISFLSDTHVDLATKDKFALEFYAISSSIDGNSPFYISLLLTDGINEVIKNGNSYYAIKCIPNATNFLIESIGRLENFSDTTADDSRVPLYTPLIVLTSPLVVEKGNWFSMKILKTGKKVYFDSHTGNLQDPDRTVIVGRVTKTFTTEFDDLFSSNVLFGIMGAGGIGDVNGEGFIDNLTLLTD